MKKTVITLLKFGVSGAIIAYLLKDAYADENFTSLASQPKNWGLLGLALVSLMLAVVGTIVRWHFLVRALDLPFQLKDAFRLGFLGYLLNFVSFGSVGGDLVKAVFIARQIPGRRAEAVATVVIDRVIGLYFLFIVATIALVLTGQLQSNVREIQLICRGTLIAAAVGAAGICMLLIPGFTNGALSEFLGNLPRVGGIFRKLIGAIRMYRSRLGVLVLTGVISLGVHTFSSLGIYLTARGLLGQAPSLASHFVTIPLAMVTGVLPLPVGGLGAFEAVLDFLYRNIPGGIVVTKGQGLLVAFGYRVITLAIAMIGVCYYLASRREVSQLLHEAEETQQAESLASSTEALPGAAPPAHAASPEIGFSQPGSEPSAAG